MKSSYNYFIDSDLNPFGMLSKSYESGYRFGFNGFEKDDEIKGNGNSFDMGERLYDPRIGRALTPDPLMNQNATWSPYTFAIDNPIVFVDEKGEWPGIAFMYFEGEIGSGLGYGLNYIEQSGIAWDKVGKTHFTLTSALYIINQNLEEGSANPQYLLGISAGLSGGFTYNWSKNTFLEFLGSNTSSFSIPTSKPNIRAKLGVGLGFNSESISFTLGLQAGFKFSTISTSVKQSISLTSEEAEKVNNSTDVINESWILNNQTQILDKEGKIIGYKATVATRNTKGDLIDTGIEVFSGTINNDGEIESSGVWSSKSYQSEATEVEKEE